MPSLSPSIAPLNPFGAALVALERVMLELDYNGRCRCDAKTIVRHSGCVADCVPECIDPEHEAVCEAAYVDALPPVDYGDPAWGHTPNAVVPPAPTDAELGADWPGEPDDSWKPWYERRQNAAEAAANEAERRRSRYLSS
jgi:hypothetical protein